MLIIREPAGYQHGDVAMRLGAAMHAHAEAHDLGRVFAAETGFTLARKPDTVRAPDVAFISNERLPDPPPRGFAEMAPDLAVEVLSPDDRAGEVLDKVADWLKAGTPLVWVVDPLRATARVYRADGSESLLGESDVLQGEDVLPGFTCAIATLLRSKRA
jgi:Uma2 family endonuclease